MTRPCNTPQTMTGTRDAIARGWRLQGGLPLRIGELHRTAVGVDNDQAVVDQVQRLAQQTQLGQVKGLR